MNEAITRASSRIYLRPFTVEDADALYEQLPEKGAVADREQWLEWGHDAEKYGPAYSGFLGDELVGAAGIIMRPKHKGDAWTILSAKALKEHPIAVYRWIKRSFAIFTETIGLKKVRALVQCDHEAGCRMVEHLGFAGKRVIKGYRLYVWKA